MRVGAGRIGPWLAAVAVLSPSAWAEPIGGEAVAVLQGLDKVTARVSTIEAPIEVPVRFGTLEITAHTCAKQPPEEPPEVTAFLEIVDVKPGQPRQRLFTGWMFASSPALSALEHPVYDVWVTDCRTSAPESPAGIDEKSP